jgi:uncharacterized protein YabE (DUF348 family)
VPFTKDTKFAALLRSRGALVALATLVVLAVAGTTWGYASLSTSVTLSLDGESKEVSATGDTVADVLEEEGIELAEHDIVVPSPDEEISEGSRINVKFARPLALEVDGEEETFWVTSTDVAAALGEIGSRFLGADLSTSRGTGISRDGMRLEVVTPKKLELKLGDRKAVRREITALTTRDALDELGVKVEKHDVVKPGPKTILEDGDTIVFTDIRVATKRVKAESIDFSTVERSDGSMLEGETEVVRSGEAGVRDVTYQMTYRNGQLVGTKILRQKVIENPVDAIVRVGTKEEPEPVAAPTSNYASGGTVWDQLAACESGGNWAINTGNGYYGGLQFNLGTWQSYGGPGYPHQQSRETQIMIAERVRAATGGYGSWPHCSQSLGLPQ